MNIAIDLPNYDAAWDIVGGALRYANSADDIAILVPHAPMARAEDQDPANWDGAIVQKPRSDLDIPQVGVCASHVGPGVNVSIKYGTVMTLAIEQFVALRLLQSG